LDVEEEWIASAKANNLLIGHILQETKGDGISKEQNARKIEGGRGPGDAGTNWASCARAKAMRERVRVCIVCTVHMGGAWDLGITRNSPRTYDSLCGDCLEHCQL
jgi:hypothetical protein